MSKCPRCENEKLRDGQKFCQMCGLNLNMNKENAIISLKKLVDENKLLYPSERQAIEYAILELERTAQEVPIQEQSISNSLKANITIKGLDVLKKFSTDSSLGIDTICTDKTSVEVTLLES